MITKIGLVAGDIWNYLDHHNQADQLKNIIAELGEHRDMILMSIGWLAREGHVVLAGESSNYTVTLANKN